MDTVQKKIKDLKPGEWVRMGKRLVEVVDIEKLDHLTDMLGFAVYSIELKAPNFAGAVRGRGEEVVEVSTLVISQSVHGVQ